MNKELEVNKCDECGISIEPRIPKYSWDFSCAECNDKIRKKSFDLFNEAFSQKDMQGSDFLYKKFNKMTEQRPKPEVKLSFKKYGNNQ